MFLNRLLSMNAGDPHLTLALSPPIGWERRGDALRRDREQADADPEDLRFTIDDLRLMRPCFLNRLLSMNSGDPHLSLTLSPPIGWERRGIRLRRGYDGTGSRRMTSVA